MVRNIHESHSRADHWIYFILLKIMKIFLIIFKNIIIPSRFIKVSILKSQVMIFRRKTPLFH